MHFNDLLKDGVAECLLEIQRNLKSELSPNQRQIVTSKLSNLKKLMSKKFDKLNHSNRSFSKLMFKMNITDKIDFNIDDDEHEAMSIDEESSNDEPSFFEDESRNESFDLPSTSRDNVPKPVGRPRKTHTNEMQKSKIYEFIEKVVAQCSLEIALCIAKKCAKNEENDDAKVILKELWKLERENNLKNSGVKIKKGNEIKKLHAAVGMEIILQNDLTVDTYCNIRLGAKKNDADIFPTYKEVKEFENSILPEFKVDDNGASVKLQTLNDDTAKGIFAFIHDHLSEEIEKQQIPEDEKLTATLINGYGGDGTRIGDKTLLIYSTTPLQMLIRRANGEPIYEWRNTAPSSPYWSRTIEMTYQPETRENVKESHEKIKREIDSLNSIFVKFSNGQDMEIISEYHLNQIDGKFFAYLCDDQSMQTCPSCNAKPKQMNKLENFFNGTFDPKDKAFNPVISPLHGCIRCVMCLFNIAIRKGIEKWRIPSGRKHEVEERKKEINNRLQETFGVRLDEIRDGAPTTTGGVCRKLLKNPKEFARCLDIDEGLVEGVSKILRTINIKEDIKPHVFGEFAREIYQKFITLYHWFYMPPTLHKILAHGEEIIRSMPLSPGMMSEEGLEAKNKKLKKIQKTRARKISKSANNKDVMTRLFLISHPIVAKQITANTAYGRKCKKRNETIPDDIKQFFYCDDENRPIDDDDDYYEEEEEYDESYQFDGLEDLEEFNEPFETYDYEISKTYE